LQIVVACVLKFDTCVNLSILTLHLTQFRPTSSLSDNQIIQNEGTFLFTIRAFFCPSSRVKHLTAKVSVTSHDFVPLLPVERIDDLYKRTRYWDFTMWRSLKHTVMFWWEKVKRL